VTRYVEERRDAFGVEPICRALGVPVSTFYARRSRKPSRRELQDRELVREIHAAREGYRRVYGVRKTWKQLKRRGVDVGRDRVARLMRREGLEGVRRGKKKRTTVADEAAVERARDLVQRDFTATRPNEKWVADVTYVRTWQGFVYLAFILDCFSRAIVGWQLATHLRTELVLDTLEMANGLRRPDDGLIAHSDRGSQGGFNWSSQRLDEEGCDGSSSATCGGSCGAASDAVAGSAVGGAAGGAATVLAGDRSRRLERGGGRRGWRVGSGRRPVVPRGWRDAGRGGVNLRCLTRHQSADTKRTHQKRHARRLATHVSGLQSRDLQEKVRRS
jgi:putative transposase